MGVHERRDDEPRRGAAVVVERANDIHRLLREADVTPLLVGGNGRPAVQRLAAVRLGSDPAREPETSETVGRHVLCLSREVGRTGHGIVADVLTVRSRNDHVGVRRVPLALPERAVAGRAEIVAKRRHAVRVEPEDVGIERVLRRAGRLRHAVERWVLAGEQRSTTRRTGDRRRVVALKVDTVQSEEVLGLQVTRPKRLGLIGLVDRRKAHFVAE